MLDEQIDITHRSVNGVERQEAIRHQVDRLRPVVLVLDEIHAVEIRYSSDSPPSCSFTSAAPFEQDSS
jgi:hypothetical protein